MTDFEKFKTEPEEGSFKAMGFERVKTEDPGSFFSVGELRLYKDGSVGVALMHRHWARFEAELANIILENVEECVGEYINSLRLDPEFFKKAHAFATKGSDDEAT